MNVVKQLNKVADHLSDVFQKSGDSRARKLRGVLLAILNVAAYGSAYIPQAKSAVEDLAKEVDRAER